LGNLMYIREAISALISSGMDPVDAAALIAAAVIEGSGSGPPKSTSALRQQRYRDRKCSVTKRNESVTPLRVVSENETVTERNESVTKRNDVTVLSLSIEEDSKKERKKEREAKRKPRHALPADFKLTDDMRQFALSRGFSTDKIQRQLERFIDHHKSQGTLSADWAASWRTWVNRSIEFETKNLRDQTERSNRADPRL
jgi:hypothetical protein